MVPIICQPISHTTCHPIFNRWTPQHESKIIGAVFGDADAIEPGIADFKEYVILVIISIPQRFQPEFDRSLLRADVLTRKIVQRKFPIKYYCRTSVTGYIVHRVTDKAWFISSANNGTVEMQHQAGYLIRS